MTRSAKATRRFRVHAGHVDGHHARVLEEVSFEAAAIAYLEDFSLEAGVADDPEIDVIVNEVETGHQHCFKVDGESGEISPCG